MDKIYIVGVEDLFEEQKYIYQANGYPTLLGELDYGMMTRHLCKAKIFKNKKEATQFIKMRFHDPDVCKAISISKKELFIVKLANI